MLSEQDIELKSVEVHKRMNITIFLSILGLATLILIVLFSIRNTDSPATIVASFMSEVKNNNYDTASSYLTNETSKTYSNFQYDKLKDFFEPGEGITIPQIDSIIIDGNEATEEVIKHDLTNGSEYMIIKLKKKFFGWKIESIRY